MDRNEKSNKTNIYFAVALAFAFALVSACSGEKPTDESAPSAQIDPETRAVVAELTAESMQTIMPALVKRVTGLVQEEGPAHAVGFCNENVGEIGMKFRNELAAKFGESHGVSAYRFGRTTQNLRNQNNAPTPEQAVVLAAWSESESRGEEATPTVIRSGEGYVGMAPIRIINESCLSCHGAEGVANAEAMAKIRELYPTDKAVGYEKEQLRGAFWVYVEL